MPSSSANVASYSPDSNSFSMAAMSPTRATCMMSLSGGGGGGGGASAGRLPISISLLSLGAAAADLDDGWAKGAAAADAADAAEVLLGRVGLPMYEGRGPLGRRRSRPGWMSWTRRAET